MRRRIVRVLTQHARFARVVLAAGAVALSAAACDVHGVSAPGTLSSLVVTPNPVTLAVNGTQQFTAVGKDFAGTPLTQPITWSVVSGGGAISASGLFTAGTVPGTFANTVKATSGSLSATATVTVTVGPLASITVTPNPATLAVSTAQQFTAVGKDAVGNVVQFTPTWSVVNGGGTVNASGLFTAGTTIGTYTNTVQAASGGTSGTATVIVTAGPLANIAVTPNPVTLSPGVAQQFTAVGTDANGNVVVITPVWTVVNGGGSINASSGVFTAGGTAGTYTNTVKATSGTISGSATVIVTFGPLATIVVTPNPATLAVGATQQFAAVGQDASGNVVPFTPTWSVINGGGTIGITGLFTAGPTNGTYTNTVRASSGTISGTATVIVTAGPLANITVTPNPVTLTPGATQQYTAVGTDATGNVVLITPVWSVANGGGSINASSGLFTAGGTAGTYTNTVKATSGTISGSATVTIVAGPLASITVTPSTATLAPGAAQLFTATGADARGNAVAITPVWSVVNGGGTINAGSGLFTAGATAGTYANTVKATSGGISGTANVIVTSGPAANIVVSPNPATLTPGATQQFTATATDANGNAVAITPVWSVVNGGGTINASTGLFTAGTVAGTYTNTVKATSGTASGTATVIVSAGPVTNIVVSPNPVTLAPGFTQQFTAVGTDANGNVVAITPVWSVVNGGGVITPTGLFTAGAVGGTFVNTVKATSGTASGFATVTVLVPVVPALASITVLPNPATVLTGGSQQFTAVGRDVNNNVIVITPVWTVVNGGGTITATGLFTAGAVAGTFTNTVKATSGSISGTATVNVTAVIPAPFINLGLAAPNGIMAGTRVTCVSGGLINADISISPGSTLTGFGPCVFTGVTHLGDAIAAQAQIDLTNAYNTLAGLPCPPANAIVANLGGTTKAAGVYCTASGIGITGILTLDGGGDPNAVFVFQAGTSLTTAGDIVLINGAQAKNVYFQIGSSATLGTASQIQGNIITLTSITLVDNATLRGRALARNGAVTLGTNNVITLP